MSYLFEIIEHKKILDKKIDELKNILSKNQDDIIANSLIDLIDLRLSDEILLSSINESLILTIGKNDLNLNKVNLILESLLDKINMLTSLINDSTCTLDKLSLQQQRDKFYEEYILLSMGLNRLYLEHQV